MSSIASRNGCFGLDIDLPGAAEQVEVVDVEPAERRLQRIEDVGDLDAQHLRLVAVDIETDLRRVGGEGAEDTPASSGCWLALTTSAAHDRRDARSGGWPCSASSTYWNPPVLPRPMIGGRLNGKTTAPGIAASCGRSAAMMASALCDCGGALLVGLQPDDEEGLVRRGDGSR